MLVPQVLARNRPRRQNRVSSRPSASTSEILAVSAASSAWPQRLTAVFTVCHTLPSSAATSLSGRPRPAWRVARHTADAVTAALARQPRHLVRTITWDQGREMARWQHVENATGAKVYFCDPRSPWQRPTNEQTNGLLRRWLPKGTDLNTHTGWALLQGRV